MKCMICNKRQADRNHCNHDTGEYEYLCFRCYEHRVLNKVMDKEGILK